MKQILQVATFIILSVLSTVGFSAQQSVEFNLQGEGKIAWVFDGDTFRIEPKNQSHITEMSKKVKKPSSVEKHYNWGQFTVRLANVDTAESVHYDKSKNTKKGKETSTAVKEILKVGTPVSYQCYDLGYYDRAICNVTIKPTGKKSFDFAEWLIKNGHASYVTKYGTNPFNHEGLLSASK